MIAIFGLEAEVNNGGFDQYFFNEAGAHAVFAVEALKTIGAHAAAGLVAQANAVFGDDGPPRDTEERRAALDHLSTEATARFEQLDAQFFSYPDDISGLLEAHLRVDV